MVSPVATFTPDASFTSHLCQRTSKPHRGWSRRRGGSGGKVHEAPCLRTWGRCCDSEVPSLKTLVRASAGVGGRERLKEGATYRDIPQELRDRWKEGCRCLGKQKFPTKGVRIWKATDKRRRPRHNNTLTARDQGLTRAGTAHTHRRR